jgi:hypothetical protein
LRVCSWNDISCFPNSCLLFPFPVRSVSGFTSSHLASDAPAFSQSLRVTDMAAPMQARGTKYLPLSAAAIRRRLYLSEGLTPVTETE